MDRGEWKYSTSNSSSSSGKRRNSGAILKHTRTHITYAMISTTFTHVCHIFIVYIDVCIYFKQAITISDLSLSVHMCARVLC